MSVKDQCTIQMFDANFAQWILSLIDRSTKKEIHSFCLDFGSALLANIFHSHSVLEKLEKNPQLLFELLSRLIALLKEPLPTSVLIHLLICLSYLSKERFSQVLEEVRFVEKISDFVEWFTVKHSGVQQQTEPATARKTALAERKTVLDLCAHMFHPKDTSADMSGTMEYNELKQEEKIKEFEQLQGNLIFECF